MSSPREVYRKECESLNISPNSGLLRTIPENLITIRGITVMHFARNFIGDRGLIPLLRVIPLATSLHTLNLRDNGIRNDGVRAICTSLRSHPSLRVLELSGNPFTYLAARKLVHLCEDNMTLTFIGLDGTLMTERLKISIQHRIKEAIKRRETCRQIQKKSTNIHNNSQLHGNDVNLIKEAVMMPIVAEDAEALNKITSAAAAATAAILSHRNSSSLRVPSSTSSSREKKEENNSSVIKDINNSCEEVGLTIGRPPLANPSPPEIKEIPAWFDDDDDIELNVNNNINDDNQEEMEEEIEVEVEVETGGGRTHVFLRDDVTEGCNIENTTSSPVVDEQEQKEEKEKEKDEEEKEEEKELVNKTEMQEIEIENTEFSHPINNSMYNNDNKNDNELPLDSIHADGASTTYSQKVDRKTSGPSAVSSLSLEMLAAEEELGEEGFKNDAGGFGGVNAEPKEDEFLDLLFGSETDWKK